MAQSQPPITRTTHTLPFDKLSPRGFERLGLLLVEREGYQRAGHLRSGQRTGPPSVTRYSVRGPYETLLHQLQ